MTARPLDPEHIRSLLHPERRRDEPAPNQPCVRIVVDGTPAVLYGTGSADAQQAVRAVRAASVLPDTPDPWPTEHAARTEQNLARLRERAMFG